jgi:curved DNA-binding protein CbpA
LENYYEILGVSTTANNEEIKDAFWSLARVHHPDVSEEGGAVEKFQVISLANDTLSDPEKRKKYDRRYHFNKREPQKPKHRDPRYRPKSATYQAYTNIKKEKDVIEDPKLKWIRYALFVTMVLIGFTALYYCIRDLNTDGIEAQERGVLGVVFCTIYFSILGTGWWILGRGDFK